MKTIVYTSNSGFTKSYAEMLGRKTGLPVCSFAEAKEKLARGSEIIYMGWICAGSVKNYQKAAKLFSVKALLPVGMAPDGQNSITELRNREKLSQDMPVFYLQGGYAPEKMRGIYKLMMNTMAATVLKQLEAKKDRTPEDEEAMKMFKEGCNCVSEENLQPVMDYLGQAKAD